MTIKEWPSPNNMPVISVDTLPQCNAIRQQDNIDEQQVWAGMIAVRPTRATPNNGSHPFKQ
eukprot:2481209-Karenia_brevis.AAC.1